MLHTWFATPASIAGVTRSDWWMRPKCLLVQGLSISLYVVLTAIRRHLLKLTHYPTTAAVCTFECGGDCRTPSGRRRTEHEVQSRRVPSGHVLIQTVCTVCHHVTIITIDATAEGAATRVH